MADAIFDTTVFIDYHRGIQAAKELVASVINKKLTASYSALTVAELWQGAMRDRKEEMEYSAILACMEEVSLSSDICRIAGTNLRAYGDNERAKYFADALIAATAEIKGEQLFTRNDKDMKRFYSNIVRY